MKWKLIPRKEATVRAYCYQQMLLKENPLGNMGEVKLVTALLAQALEDALSSPSWEGRTARRWFDTGEAYLWTRLMGLPNEEYMKLLLKQAVCGIMAEDLDVIYRNIRRS